MKEIFDVEMSSYTSFRTGGQVRRLVIVDNEEELKDTLESLADEDNSDYLILGNGSNTLFASKGYEGTVIKLGEGFDYVEIDSDAGVARSGAATLLPVFAKTVCNKGYTGLEFATGIPGSVGGAVFMNAGAYDGEIKDRLISVKVLTKKSCEDETPGVWQVETLPAEELELSYRHSKLMASGDILLEATFGLKEGDYDEIQAKMKDFAERRSSKQPLEYPSAGSFFKRPEGFFAGKLVEDAGLKGYTVGGAQVSEKHAGFVINKGGATPEDIIKLKNDVTKVVKEKFGVSLEPEVRIIGE